MYHIRWTEIVIIERISWKLSGNYKTKCYTSNNNKKTTIYQKGKTIWNLGVKDHKACDKPKKVKFNILKISNSAYKLCVKSIIRMAIIRLPYERKLSP